jgi:hypothetical protein
MLACPDHRWAVRVLDLEPVPGWAGAVWRGQPLGHNALQAHCARLLEHQLAEGVGVVVHDDPGQSAVDQVCQPFLALTKGQRTVVDPVQLKQVESIEHGLSDGAASVERIENGDPVRPAHSGLAVNRERLGSQLRRGTSDRRIAIGPVITAPGKQPHGLTLAADDEPKALKRLDAGDVLMVTRLDRLARSTRDLLNTLAAVADRNAGFKSLADTWADTTTPHGRLMLTVLGGLAESVAVTGTNPSVR